MVNTFLPLPNLTESAKALDYRRLGKQRVEVLQILKANLGETKGWVNHPAAKMWKGYEYGLALYGIEICSEWVNRGYKDTCGKKIYDLVFNNGSFHGVTKLPPWFGDIDFHNSHKSNLLRKFPEFYSQYHWEVGPDLPYVWPIGGNNE